MLANLTLLAISGNGISGWMPSEIGMLGKLEVLILYDTSVGGSIPEELYYGLKKMRDFHLSNSAFSGTISTKVGMWTNLKIFEISNNNFQGSLPDIPTWGNLNLFAVDGNHLTGTFPSALSFPFHHVQIIADCP